MPSLSGTLRIVGMIIEVGLITGIGVTSSIGGVMIGVAYTMRKTS